MFWRNEFAGLRGTGDSGYDFMANRYHKFFGINFNKCSGRKFKYLCSGMAASA